MKLEIDRNRYNSLGPNGAETDISVRAALPDGAVEVVDIAVLTSASLLEWLTSHRGDNPIAENTVGVLLGHGRLHKA